MVIRCLRVINPTHQFEFRHLIQFWFQVVIQRIFFTR